MSLDRLFEPLALGQAVARNRIMRAATSTNLAEERRVSMRLLAHYERLARGGVGTIVTEAMRMHPGTLRSTAHIGAFDEANVPGLARWASTVHEHGALLIGQLGHSGRQHTSSHVPGRLVGPSPIACPRSGGVPHELTVEEIDELVAGFRVSARNLAMANFDGVELNAAQGHLLQQFLSPFSNTRSDEYGGSIEARSWFLRRILTDIRDVIGKAVLGVRIGIDELTDGGWNIESTQWLVERLSDDGLADYVSLSQGNFNTIDAHLPDRHVRRVPFASIQAEVARASSRLPVIACTRIVTPQEAAGLVAEWADGVALGRALTVDPDWPNKARDGQDASVRLCIQCNHCWAGLHEGSATLSCVQNAEVGNELAFASRSPADRTRTVVVVGGGPGGLEAARVAADRGHRVTLFERSDQLGGKVPMAAGLAGHSDLLHATTWLADEVRRLDVDVHLGREAAIEDIKACAPDVVVIATGARPVLPPIASDGTVQRILDVGELDADLSARQIVLFDEDGHYWAAQVAEELALRGARVHVVTRFFEPFRELPIVSRIGALRILDEHEAVMVPVHEPTRIAGGSVYLQHYDSKRPHVIRDVHAACWVGPQVPNDELVPQLRSTLYAVDVHVIGDAFAPRRIIHAIHEANKVAAAL